MLVISFCGRMQLLTRNGSILFNETLWNRRALGRSTKALLLLLTCFCILGDTMGNKNPCQRYKGKQYGCDRIVLPKKFCVSCGIGPFNATGDYLDCTRTTRLESSPACLDVFQQYVDLNPCDVARQDALMYYNSTDPATREKGRQMLDYFQYMICENGCDCIPQINADPSHKSIDITRGNCQAHTHYDVCKIFPDIKIVQLQGSSEVNTTNMPLVCPLIARWLASLKGANFLAIPHTAVDPYIANFLNNLLDAEQILETNYWNSCFALETSQSRVIAATPAPSAASAKPSAFPSPSPTEDAEFGVASIEPIRINAGNLTSNYTDKSGKRWLSDRYFSNGGNVFTRVSDIAQTEDDVLYQSERYSDRSLRYEVPVTFNATYKVKLGFAEIFYLEPNQRVFHIRVEGKMIYRDFDIIANAKRWRKPVVVETLATVTDGKVSINLVPVRENPKISWIQVELAG